MYLILEAINYYYYYYYTEEIQQLNIKVIISLSVPTSEDNLF